ncbi:hypothetical protein PRIPAC_88306, partial [Pristionchus pacificus]|uniref:G protein-coupled receptor n=1 Tax=Pristionchus pacificus TaxID=54126 RepID=A0A2A6B5J6_PRIPA
MNSTELSVEFQSNVVWAHHICGSISFIFSTFVCLLIVFEKDSRGKAYRKYLFSLQFTSILADLFMSTYSPFVLSLNCRVMYGDLILSQYIAVDTSLIIYVALFLEVVFSYFACVYYRRTKLIAPEARFNFFGWRQGALLVGIQAYLLLIDASVCYIVWQLQATVEVSHLHFLPPNSKKQEIPPIIGWLRQKSTIFLINSERLSYPALFFSIGSALIFAKIITAMIIRLIREIKHEMERASPATKKYQTRAVFSLTMQGAVPRIFYAVPTFSLLGVYIYLSTVLEVAARSRTASAISILSINLMTQHTFAHSLTILACSPSYRKTIRNIAGNIVLRVLGHSRSNSSVETINERRHDFTSNRTLMQSTELSERFESAVTLSHHISGAISFTISVLTCLLIVSERDARSMGYRKYVFSLQFSSLVTDLYMSFYSPIVMLNCRVMYSISTLAGAMKASTGLKLLPPESYFLFDGWKQSLLFVATQIYLLLINYFVYCILTELYTPYEMLPFEISWLQHKPGSFYFNSDRMNYTILMLTIILPIAFGFAIILMIVELIHEINYGMRTTSPATKIDIILHLLHECVYSTRARALVDDYRVFADCGRLFPARGQTSCDFHQEDIPTTGAISCTISVLTCLLIVSERDARSMGYRKYLFSLQFSSLVTDLYMSFYSPFVMLNCRVMYSISTLAGAMQASTGLKLLPPESYFLFDGWKQSLLFVATQIYLLLINYFVYCILTELYTPYEMLPFEISWLQHKPVSFYFNSNRMNYTILMPVPGLMYFVPSFCLLNIYFYSVIVGLDLISQQSNRFVFCKVYPTLFSIFSMSSFILHTLAHSFTIIASTLFSIFSMSSFILYTLAHSFTIIACSPTYRKTIRNTICKLPCIPRIMPTGASVTQSSEFTTRMSFSAIQEQFRSLSGRPCLIIPDADPRGKSFRKYLVSVQIASILPELWPNLYTPFIQLNSRLLYSDSFVAEYIDMSTATGIVPSIVYLVPNATLVALYVYMRIVGQEVAAKNHADIIRNFIAVHDRHESTRDYCLLSII